jgi:hypothetical protein
MTEIQESQQKEKESKTDWESVQLKDDSGSVFGGFLRTNKTSQQTEFCYQPNSEGAKITNVEPYTEVKMAGVYSSESEYTGNLVHVHHLDGRRQAVYVPKNLTASDGSKVEINTSTNFFAIDSGNTPSND